MFVGSFGVFNLGSAIQAQQVTNQLNPDELDELEIADEAMAATDDLAAAAEEMSQASSALGGPVKIIVSQFQILSALAVSIPIDWPDLITDFSLSISIVRLDLPEIFSRGCLTQVSQVMFAVVGLSAVFVVLAVVAGFMMMVFDKPAKEAKNFFYKWAQAVAFLAYPEVGRCLPCP